jgi:membrane fusion protein (multidrug efflux system)
MIKRMLIMLGVVLVVIAGIAFWKVTQVRAAIEMSKQFAPPPAAVTTTLVKTTRWQPTLTAVGTLKAVNGVTVSTDLPGIVASIEFQSGALVEKGALLIQLDRQQEEAQLRAAEARRDLAKANLDRQRELIETGAVAKSEFDAADSEYRQAWAAVDEMRAVIARKTIVAPFAGRLGIRQVDVGQYLNVGVPIVRLESVDPIHVEFAVPQLNLDQVAVGKAVRLRVPGLGSEEFAGTITAIEARVDEATRNVMVQATVPNPAQKLRPGMYVNVEVFLPESEVIAIPSAAVSYAPYGDTVFVVKTADGGKMVEQRFVKVGASRGDQVHILSGLKVGEEIVTSGAFKLRNDLPVQINNSVQPSDDAHPTPPNT